MVKALEKDLMLSELTPREQRLHVARQMQQKYKNKLAKEQKDKDDTATSATTVLGIYRVGDGRPNEPPEGAGAPNRPRIDRKRD